MRTRGLGWVLGTVAALVLLAGLAAPAPAATVLRIAADGDISDVDLHMTTHYLNRVVLLNVYDMLFALGEDMGPRPSLAEKYAVSADGLTYTVMLRKGVKFHNGKTLEAKDVVYSITKMQAKGPRSGQFKKLIKTVEAADPLTVKFVLNEVNAGFIATLANPIAPAVIYPDGEAERQGGTLTKPVGTGPFEFVEWKKDSVIRLKKFAGYTVDDRPTSGFTGKRLALVDQVDFIPIRDSSVRAAALERGDVDVALALTQQDVERYKGKADVTVKAIPGISFADLRFGFKKGIFKDNVKLRQAAAYALDKDEIVKGATFGLGKAAPAGIPVGTPYFGPVQAADPYAKANPEKAKQLMKEAGYKGEEIILDSHLQPSIYPDIAVVMQAQFQAVGLNVKVRTLESAALQTTWDGGEFAFFLSGLSPRPDAEIYYCQFWESTSTSTGYKNDNYDKLCRAARTTIKDEDRKKVFADLETLLRADVPWVPLVYIPQVEGWRNNVKGWVQWSAGYARAWNVSVSQ